MLCATLVFAIQDGISRQLADKYNVMTVVMIRYWFFAAFVVAWSHFRGGGIRKVAHTTQPIIQMFRGVLLVAEISVMVFAYTLLGLIESHVIFACYPLLVIALSGSLLGESVGWRRWLAVGIGFIGVVIVLRPSSDVFSIEAMVPLLGTFMFGCLYLAHPIRGSKRSRDDKLFLDGCQWNGGHYA